MGDLGLIAGSLIGMAIGWILYGFYCCLFLLCLRVLHTSARSSRIVWYAMIMIFSLVTAHIVLDSILTYNGFVKYRVEPGTFVYFAKYHRPLVGADYSVYWAANLGTECLLLWRVWVVWFGTRRIWLIPPSVLFLVSIAVSTYGLKVHLYQSIHHIDYDDKNAGITGAVALLLLAQNLLTTGMIAGRLWYMGRLVSTKTSRFPYGRIIRAVVESSTLYSAALLTAVVLDLTKLTVWTSVAIQITSVLVGVAPTLIVCAINIRNASDNSTRSPVTARGNISPLRTTDVVSTVLRFRPPTHGIDLELSEVSSGSNGGFTNPGDDMKSVEENLDRSHGDDIKTVDLLEKGTCPMESE